MKAGMRRGIRNLRRKLVRLMEAASKKGLGADWTVRVSMNSKMLIGRQ